MLSELCHYLNNYFDRDRPKIAGNIKIVNGEIDFSTTAPLDGQYYRIVGSVLNDGVHKHPADDLRDEEFEGTISLMAIPQAVIDLDGEIEQWVALYGKADSAAMAPFQSESFGGYSYTKACAQAATGGGTSVSWQDVFKNRLAQWVRIRSV